MEAVGSETSVSNSRVKSIPKDVTCRFVRNVVNFLPDFTASHTDSILDSNRPETLKSHTVKLSAVIFKWCMTLTTVLTQLLRLCKIQGLLCVTTVNGASLSEGALWGEPGGRAPLLVTPKDMLGKAMEMSVRFHRGPAFGNIKGRSSPRAFERREKFLYLGKFLWGIWYVKKAL